MFGSAVLNPMTCIETIETFVILLQQLNLFVDVQRAVLRVVVLAQTDFAFLLAFSASSRATLACTTTLGLVSVLCR
jgi:hypothetical protein